MYMAQMLESYHTHVVYSVAHTKELHFHIIFWPVDILKMDLIFHHYCCTYGTLSFNDLPKPTSVAITLALGRPVSDVATMDMV